MTNQERIDRMQAVVDQHVTIAAQLEGRVIGEAGPKQIRHMANMFTDIERLYLEPARRGRRSPAALAQWLRFAEMHLAITVQGAGASLRQYQQMAATGLTVQTVP